MKSHSLFAGVLVLSFTIGFLEGSQPPALTGGLKTTTPQEDVDRAALSALNAQFIKNFIQNDTAAHNRIIHRDFICINGSGKVIGREEYMNDWAHGYDPNVYRSFTYHDESIRIFGTMALVRAQTTSTRIDNGKTVVRNSLYTDTYIKENGRWWCVQAQITGVKNPERGPQNSQ